jgi:CDGSH-type Zn-finger protein/uncharacterized Fe-S cluster protein YjdI
MTTSTEPEILVEHRSELLYLLTEAAEIEHGLMCCYLYAAYSLKGGERDGLTAVEAALVEKFRAAILDIARDEMVHLALAANLLTAVGGAPHFHRANFPVSPGYHPAGVVVSLAPFDRATLDHFLFLERPEGVSLPDGEGFAPKRDYSRTAAAGRLVPTAHDYQTVGHLYRGIRAGLVALSEKYGEDKVFSGDPRLQVGPDVIPMRGISTISSLATALAAIDTIVTQGEGAPGHHDESHYQRFLALDLELKAAMEQNPSFCPAHRAARNPVMRRPPQPEGLIWVSREPAASLLDLANAVYGLMVRSLTALFGHVCSGDVRDALVSATTTTMRVLTPLATYLPRLPATEDDDGPRAGLTFTMSRSVDTFPDVIRGLHVLAESARSIAATFERVAIPLESSFAQGRDAMQKLAIKLDETGSRAAAQQRADLNSTVTRSPAPPKPPAPLPTEPKPGFELVRGKRIALQFEAKRCIHARHCVLETPEVFLANVKGPWIHPDDAPIDRLVHVARSCPSGAITYERLDGGDAEEAPPVNLVRVRERGPLAFLADLHIEGQEPCLRATLCRCGQSQNKPYCDGSHNAAGFDASGEPATIPTDPMAVRGGPLEIAPQKNGPLRARGALELLSGTGRTIRRVQEAYLCRCGGSANKPYCDGTHAKNGFTADGAE